ncbi:hypothetical protein [Oleiharenicola lentus]|uniref:hypothetical protein n=1 Tax=Oleiharenicola lentus TaxID=2508720 RepID=UPI003F67C244
MKTLLSVAALLVPFMALAAPAENTGAVRDESASYRGERRDDRGDNGRNNNPSSGYDRRDDRNDDRRPAPAPVFRREHVDRVINAVFREVLLRDADAAGLRNYRHRLLNEGWTEDRMRAALRDSSEFRGTVVNTIITRAYRDILGRAPDAAGLENYRYRIIARGMTEEGLRNVLIGSDEYRNRLVMIAANDARGANGGGSRNDGRRMR